jgi:hypothetical protein
VYRVRERHAVVRDRLAGLDAVDDTRGLRGSDRVAKRG